MDNNIKKELTCIVCPLGCSLNVTMGEEITVTGNTCPRGEAYAKTELTAPVRTITTTVICNDGTPVPVKTATPIPKDKMFEAMDIINNVTADLPVSAGDVIIENVFGSQVIATADKPFKKE